MQSFDQVVLVFCLRPDGSLLALKSLVYPNHSTMSRNIFETMNFLDNVFLNTQKYYLFENLERQYLLGIVGTYLWFLLFCLIGLVSPKTQTSGNIWSKHFCQGKNSTLDVPIFFCFLNSLLRCMFYLRFIFKFWTPIYYDVRNFKHLYQVLATVAPHQKHLQST